MKQSPLHPMQNSPWKDIKSQNIKHNCQIPKNPGSFHDTNLKKKFN